MFEQMHRMRPESGWRMCDPFVGSDLVGSAGEADGVAFPLPLPGKSPDRRPVAGARLVLGLLRFGFGLPLAVDVGGFIPVSSSESSPSWNEDGGGNAKADEDEDGGGGGASRLDLDEDASDDRGRWAASVE